MVGPLLVFSVWRYRKYRAHQRSQQLSQLIPINLGLPTSSAKQETDAYIIEETKLRINFESPIGKGFSSFVYRAFMEGGSPLIDMVNSYEVKRFRDCNVAVKIALNLGHDENEMLRREIDMMKNLGYQEQVIGFLGWFMQGDRMGIVFELAEKDLLTHVKDLYERNPGQLNAKETHGILWQVAKGNFLSTIQIGRVYTSVASQVLIT